MIELFEFTYAEDFFTFNVSSQNYRNKEIVTGIKVKVALHLV